ncbi:hypothetical protein CBL_21376 [Carabus blaptoides fortunei]
MEALTAATSVMGLVNKIQMFNGNTTDLPVKQFIEQRAGESVDAHVSRLRSIGSHLFDKSDNAEELRIQNKMLDQRLLDQLFEGLLPVLRRPVLNADPRTFEEGINTAKISEPDRNRYNTSTIIIIGTGIPDIPASCKVHGPNYLLLPHSTTEIKIASARFNIIILPLHQSIIESSNFSKVTGIADEGEITSLIKEIDTETLQNGISLAVWKKHVDAFRYKKYKSVRNSISVGTGATILLMAKDNEAAPFATNTAEIINSSEIFPTSIDIDIEERFSVPDDPAKWVVDKNLQDYVVKNKISQNLQQINLENSKKSHKNNENRFEFHKIFYRPLKNREKNEEGLVAMLVLYRKNNLYAMVIAIVLQPDLMTGKIPI